MKNNKILIVIIVLVLNIVVGFTIGQSLTGKSSQYEIKLEQARAYAEDNLCSKSIDAYNEAVMMEDTLELRLEMLDVYEKGIDGGEFTSTYDIFTSITSMVDLYSKNPVAYEAACKLLLKYNQYENCAKLLMQARDLEITSELIEEYRLQVRYQYMKYFCMYTDVKPCFNGAFVVETEDGFTYVDADASSSFKGKYTTASSYSEGYAFVQVADPSNKTKKNIIINKDEQRQIYLDGVESSSGVGAAKNADGEKILLLAAKVGKVYKYYTLDGQTVLDEYAFAGRFRNNVAAVKTSDGKWKLINGTGAAITDKTFSDVILNEFDECAPKGIIIAKEGNKYHIYDVTGNKVGDFACDYAKAFIDDYAAFKNGDRWGFVDAKGNVIIEPQYEDAKSFSNSLGAVKTGNGWTFISPKNEVVVQESFEDVGYLNDNGICFVKFDGYWSYLKMYYTGK